MTHGPRTLLLGDSFVSRLSDVRGVVLEVTGTRVHFHGEPGTTVRGLVRELDRRMDRMYRDGLPFPYEVVVVSIGGNDLCNAHLTCERFVSDLANLAQTLITRFGVAKVILCQILHRTRFHPRYMRGLTLAEYNSRVDTVNSTLRSQFSGSGNVVYWPHHHSCLGNSHLSRDGVHMNNRGLQGFRRSIHFALVYHGRM